MTDPLWLEGIRILDFSRLLPGPFCTLLLADMGADVIKIEDVRGGDYARYYPPMVDDVGVFFASLNRNKRSMTLNLKSEEGVAIARRLAAEADVVIESFRPGVMDRLGVGYEALKNVNPALIYCAITGYGQDGPFRDRAGHDMNYMAHAGLLDQNGEPEAPTVPGFQLADIAGGALFAAVGISSALFHRERSGEGAFIDISMTEGSLAFATPMLAAAAAGESVERSRGMLTGGIPAYNVYRTLDDRFLAVGSLEPKFWMGFVQAIGAPELVGEGHGSGEEAQTVQEKVQELIRQKTFEEWMSVFGSIDVCVEGVLTMQEVLESELHQVRERFFQLSGIHHTRTPLTPIDRQNQPPPELGEHTTEILQDAGFGADDIERFAEGGAI